MAPSRETADILDIFDKLNVSAKAFIESNDNILTLMTKIEKMNEQQRIKIPNYILRDIEKFGNHVTFSGNLLKEIHDWFKTQTKE